MGTDEERAAREAEVAELMRRAQDPDDPYDGHHGNDRSDDSIALALERDPELAARIEHNRDTGVSS